MARPAVGFKVDLKVTFTEIPDDEVIAWRAGNSLLLQWIKKAKRLMGVGRSFPVLFSLEVIAKRQRSSAPGSILAWVIGHDGSAQRTVMDVSVTR